MIAAPAVDLREGRCVQLVGGRPEAEALSRPDPVAVAKGWARHGFATLHVVDLDAALELGDNLEVVRRVVAAFPGTVQVGGGVRDGARVDALLESGAARVVAGTRAVRDPEWLEEVARRRPGRVMVALDHRDGEVQVRGWTEGAGVLVRDVLDRIAHLPLAGVLVTDVGREGRMEGTHRPTLRELVERSVHPVWASGGLTTLEDLEFCQTIGAAGAVLGMALYTGRLDAGTVAARWGAAPTDSSEPFEDRNP